MTLRFNLANEIEKLCELHSFLVRNEVPDAELGDILYEQVDLVQAALHELSRPSMTLQNQSVIGLTSLRTQQAEKGCQVNFDMAPLAPPNSIGALICEAHGKMQRALECTV